MKLYALFSLMRPKQWLKNTVVFAALIFAGKLFDLHSFLVALVTFFVFCATAGVAYIFNDVVDIEKDRVHPIKSTRPLACGQITVKTSLYFACALFIFAIVVSTLLKSRELLFMVLSYLCLNVAYSLYFKKVIIMDVLVVGLFFVLRAVAGAVAVGVNISPWLLICTLLLALFLAVGKRRAEYVLLAENAQQHRSALQHYTLPLLDMLLAACMSAVIISYSLYTITGITHPYMPATVPIIIYGIGRYLYLVQRGFGGLPEIELIKDKGILWAVIIWIAAIVTLLYFTEYKFTS